MLCAFNSLNDIESCYSKDSQNHEGDNTVVFRAEKVLAGGGVQSFYACLVSSRSEHGSPSLSDLKINFPTVSNSSIYSVWKSNKTWGECLEELNALQNATASKSVMLEDCSFLLDSESWPKLSSESAFAQGLRSENWMIAEVQTLGDILEKLALDSAAALESWELLNHSSAAGESPATTASPVDHSTRTGPVTRGTVRSYREALLTAAENQNTVSAEQLAAESARKRLAAAEGGWKPRILVQAVKHEHKDKVYRHNLIEKGINPDALYEPDEEDGGYGERLLAMPIFHFSSYILILSSLTV